MSGNDTKNPAFLYIIINYQNPNPLSFSLIFLTIKYNKVNIIPMIEYPKIWNRIPMFKFLFTSLVQYSYYL